MGAGTEGSVRIAGTEVSLRGDGAVPVRGPPEETSAPETTVWSFPSRGSWATHKGDYPGNWAPQVARNLILRFSRPGDLVVDAMVGSGTTLIECALLNRRAIGADVNPAALAAASDRLLPLQTGAGPRSKIQLQLADARQLNMVPDEVVDFYVAHPPYADMISYSEGRISSDLSSMTHEDFFNAMSRVAREAHRILKPGRRCAIMMGDLRRNGLYLPLSAKVLECFVDVGFTLLEDIIKIQWNTRATREKWTSGKYPFLLIAHEHIFVFQKL